MITPYLLLNFYLLPCFPLPLVSSFIIFTSLLNYSYFIYGNVRFPSTQQQIHIHIYTGYIFISDIEITP